MTCRATYTALFQKRRFDSHRRGRMSKLVIIIVIIVVHIEGVGAHTHTHTRISSIRVHVLRAKQRAKHTQTEHQR
jgi:hypothetical protein